MRKEKSERVCNLEWLKNIVEKNRPVSLLPRLERGKAAELVVELELCREGMECWQVKENDARDRIVFNPKSLGIESVIQIKYANYATSERNIKHGKSLHFSYNLLESRWKVDYIILYEGPKPGKYRFFVLTNAEMVARIEKNAHARKSDRDRVKPRLHLYFSKILSGGWLDHEDKFTNLVAHPIHCKSEEQ